MEKAIEIKYFIRKRKYNIIWFIAKKLLRNKHIYSLKTNEKKKQHLVCRVCIYW